MPALSNDQFRQDMPEFADTSLYPEDSLTLWMTVAKNMVNECRWGTLANTGIELLTAHYLVLAARDQDSAASGGAPGEMNGAVSSKSIDKVSVSYDTASAAMENAGDLNLTTYGVRYLRIARMMGAGGLQL
jgi:hypothetical protein